MRAEAAALRARGDIDIIIVLSHSGLDVDKIIARDGGPDIDVIVGGHSHSFMYTGEDFSGPQRPTDTYPAVVEQPATGRRVLVVQAAAYTRYLGDLTVWFDAAGNAVRWTGAPIYMDERIEPDAAVVAALQPWKRTIDAEGSRVIGRIAVPLLKGGCNAGECNAGNFVADAFAHAWHARGPPDREHWTQAAIALQAVGGIRTTLGRGELTFGDLVSAAPFENSVDVVRLRGGHLLKVLEYSVTKSWDADQFSGAHLLHVSGMRLVVNVTQPIGQRVVSVQVLCRRCMTPRYKTLNAEQEYNVAVGSYLLDGGDGFVALRDYAEDRK